MSKSKEDNFTDFILTRYLYVFDEVGLSFVESLLTHTSLEETVFWISELYHSGYSQKSWELLWFVYFDFYFVSYPGFIKYLTQKHKTFTFQSLLGVVHNLHAFKHTTPFVFLLRLLSCNRATMKDPIQPSVYKGRKPAWLLEHFPDQSLHHFIRDLFTHRYESIACHSLPAVECWNQDSDHIAMRFIYAIQTFYQVEHTVMDSLSCLLHFCFSDEREIDKMNVTNNMGDDMEDDMNVDKYEDDKMEKDTDTKTKKKNEENVKQDINEHDVDLVEEMTYRPYKNYRHVLLAVVCLFEFSISSSNETTEPIPDIIPDIIPCCDDEEGSKNKVYDYMQFLDKEYKIPTTSSWSPKYILKYYKNHTYLKWTTDTFMRKTIYLGIPQTIIDKFEINKPIDASTGKLPTYATSDNIIPFTLSRESYDYDIIDLWKDKWLYFASKSPLWYTRISNYKFVISHDDHRLDFLSDDDIESFHSMYPYDPEQESSEVVDKSIPKLYQEHLLIDWLNIVIPNKVLQEHCCGNSRFAVYLKYHTHTLLQHQHVWF